MNGGYRMKNYLKEKFSLTDEGVKNLINASLSSFYLYFINLFPSLFLIFFIKQLLEEKNSPKIIYIVIGGVIITTIYLLLRKEYDLIYNNAYKESGNIRIELIKKFSNLPMSYFTKHNLSDLSQAIMSDVEAVEHALSHAIPRFLGFILFFPLISLLLILGNMKLGIIISATIMMNFLFFFFSKEIQEKGLKKHYNKLREISQDIQESIELQQEIKSYSLTQEIKNKLFDKFEKSEKEQLKSNNVQLIAVLISSVSLCIIVAIVILVGTNLYLKNEINILILFSYILATIKLKDSVEGIMQNIAEIFYIDSRVKKIKEINNYKLQSTEGISDIKNYSIKFEDVSFSYDERNKVIENISFEIKENSVNAIIGKSGCGKSTVLKLIAKLYDCKSGKIKVGDIDINCIDTHKLFEKISVVFQEVNLFNDTILENVRIGNINATDDEVKKACKLANCDFIENLPQGYKTMIGENGARLSGGEKQRLSIARAFLKNAPIILLDEITSSLDIENEKKIQDSLKLLIKNKTVVIISHKLKAIEKVDNIIILNNKKVEAIGNHTELLKISKLYRELIKKSELSSNYLY